MKNNNKSGNNNTAIGNYALAYNTTGNNNTAIGDYSGMDNYTQSNNTFIGYNTGIDVSTNNWNNSVAIGNNVKISGNNLIVIGDASGLVYIPGYLNVSGSFYSGGTYFTSDKKIKENIEYMLYGYVVDEMRPVIYVHNKSGKMDIGLIAHELQNEYGLLVEGEKDGEEYQRISYNGLIGIVTKEIKECKKDVKIMSEYLKEIDEMLCDM